jgi:hypothetical protein
MRRNRRSRCAAGGVAYGGFGQRNSIRQRPPCVVHDGAMAT